MTPVHRTQADWIEIADNGSKKERTTMPTECWLWRGRKTTTGYARVHCSGIGDYRLSRLVVGLGRGDELCALHECDMKACVNPDHLYQGTKSQNMRDAFVRGGHKPKPREQDGEKHHGAKLTESDVRAVFLRLNCGETQADIAASLRVHHGTIQAIVSGRNWKHLKLKPNREALALLEPTK